MPQVRDSLAVYASLFIEHALPEEGIRTRSRAMAAELGVADRAAHFRASVIPVLSDKVATTAIFVENFGMATNMYASTTVIRAIGLSSKEDSHSTEF